MTIRHIEYVALSPSSLMIGNLGEVTRSQFISTTDIGCSICHTAVIHGTFDSSKELQSAESMLNLGLSGRRSNHFTETSMHI